MSANFRLIVPDLAGFGYTEIPKGATFQQSLWLDQLIALLDTLGVERVHIIGNSFVGAIALALAVHHPDRVGRVVLMGSAGVPMKLTPGLDAAWGYQPSIDNMRKILTLFAHDEALVSDDLVRARYEASLRPGVMESYSRMFPAPRQRWLDALAQDEADMRRCAALIITVAVSAIPGMWRSPFR